MSLTFFFFSGKWRSLKTLKALVCDHHWGLSYIVLYHLWLLGIKLYRPSFKGNTCYIFAIFFSYFIYTVKFYIWYLTDFQFCDSQVFINSCELHYGMFISALSTSDVDNSTLHFNNVTFIDILGVWNDIMSILKWYNAAVYYKVFVA